MTRMFANDPYPKPEYDLTSLKILSKGQLEARRKAWSRDLEVLGKPRREEYGQLGKDALEFADKTGVPNSGYFKYMPEKYEGFHGTQQVIIYAGARKVEFYGRINTPLDRRFREVSGFIRQVDLEIERRDKKKAMKK